MKPGMLARLLAALKQWYADTDYYAWCDEGRCVECGAEVEQNAKHCSLHSRVHRSEQTDSVAALKPAIAVRPVGRTPSPAK